MSNKTRSLLKLALIPLAAAIVALQVSIDPKVAEIHKGEHTALAGISNEFILGPMLGLQQAVAGALWVRADEFFHEGDYDAILPMVRMVTWLDPHQIDVYITGAWHLAYNFTDSNERSDRRYIPAAQKLLEEGVENNPTVYDIPFELGWENADKIKNYERAEYWFRDAASKKGTDQQGRTNQPAPMFVWHQLAHTLEREGKIDECLDIWRKALAMSEEKVKQIKEFKSPEAFQTRNVRDTERHNLMLTLERRFSRYVHEINFDIDKAQTKYIDMKTGEPHPANAYLATSPDDGVPIGTPRPPATAKPWETAFDVRPTFTQPKVLDLKGQFNIADGARVTIRLHDYDWREKQLKEFTFDIDQSQTIMQDQHSVRDGRWGRRIDMSKDPKMYSFTRPSYYLIFEFNPRQTSPFIQDKIGWSGEGMTDKKYLWVDRSVNPPVRIIRKVYRISRDQVMGRRPITEADVIPNAEYARIQAEERAGAKQPG